MKNESFIRLRKQKNYSQSSLAEKMSLPVETIRNWENQRSIPSIYDIHNLAQILSSDINTIISIFKPEQTKVEREQKREADMYNLLIQLFWECTSIDHFTKFSSLFTYSEHTGIVCCGDYVFPFDKIYTDCAASSVAFKDSSDNYIVLTLANVLNIIPISTHYDIFTFNIDISNELMKLLLVTMTLDRFLP